MISFSRSHHMNRAGIKGCCMWNSHIQSRALLSLAAWVLWEGWEFVHSWTSQIFFWGWSNACSIFTRKMLSTADFQWWLKVWILMQTDSFAYSHLGAGPLIFIYYSPWQHVQSVCRFPPSFNFQWARRLQLVILSSVWIKGKHWTGSLQACKCSGMMQIHYTWVKYEKKSFRPTALGSLLSSSFVEVLVFCWYSDLLPCQPRQGNH